MPSDTYRFRCVNPDCQKTQSRRLGHGPNAGNYVTCKFCKAPNPGPKMTAVLTAAGHRTGSELEERTKNKRRRRQTPAEPQPATAGPATDRQTATARRARTVVKGGGRTRQPAAPAAPAAPAPPAPPPAAPPAPAEDQQRGWGHRLMYGSG